MNTVLTRKPAALLAAAFAAALLAMCGCALAAAPHAHAVTVKQTLSAPPQDASKKVKGQFAEQVVSYRGKATMKKARSTNKAVATLKMKKNALYVVPKAAGKATLRCKVNSRQGKKSFKIKVTVEEFTEPFALFKIGSTDLTAKLNSCGDAASAGVHVLSGKVAVKMANGWKLDWCSYFKKTFTTVKKGASCKLVGRGVMSMSVTKGKLTRTINVKLK